MATHVHKVAIVDAAAGDMTRVSIKKYFRAITTKHVPPIRLRS